MSKDIKTEIIKIGKDAKSASQILSMASKEIKNESLLNMANLIEKDSDKILEANSKDMENAKNKGISDAFLDRLLLDQKRISAISDGLKSIVELADPVGEEMARWQRPNGLDISRVRTPLGVIGVIYESRPNVLFFTSNS